MAIQVKCKICGEKVDKELAYCITKVNEKTGKKTNSYYCSEKEYLDDKEEKSLWRKLLLIVDDILGYTCISKTKVNMIKEIEEYYSRKQLYNCLENNKEEIKRYLDEKGIYEEYGKLSYIFACVKNKIKDNSLSLSDTITTDNSQCDMIECLEETPEDIIRRLDKAKERKTETIMDVIRRMKEDKNIE